jgi:hypothetical protein
MPVPQALTNALSLGNMNEVNMRYRYSLLPDILLEQHCTYILDKRLLQKKIWKTRVDT